MICKPCRDAADVMSAEQFALMGTLLPGDPMVYGKRHDGHDPAICRDHAIQPHGCCCAHGLTHQPAPTPRTREAQPA